MNRETLISASILSADFARLGQSIQEAESGGVDWIHVDIMDGHFVPNLTMGPAILQACRRSTDLPLDVHLMVEDPDPFLEDFAEAGADTLTVHVEACRHLHRTLQRIKELDCNAAVALNPATPLHAIHEVVGMLDMVLVMTVNPGFSGQDFIHEMRDKIKGARQLLETQDSPAFLQVDGGITAETAPVVTEAGASVLAAASAIFLHPDGIQAGVQALRAATKPKLA